jgi:2-dehydro-3-deoxyphosphogluconate aldolase / (4S)-4-hydroxy-2-oxoglutarate aldolase
MPKNPPLSSKVIVPVISFTASSQAVECVKALQAGGIGQIEVTLRHPCALECISLIASAVPDMLVMAGTVVDCEQMEQVIQSGAKVAFSPGFSEDVCKMAVDRDFSYIPAVATASEVMAAHNMGFDLVKVFPIKVLGGLDLLRAWHGPFPNMRFCPTGGLQADDVAEYFEFAPVHAIGGSWLVTADDLRNSDWGNITRKAAALTGS